MAKSHSFAVTGPYYLSSGIVNAGDKMGSFPILQQQVDTLRSKGYGDIRLVGAGARPDLAALNGPLSDFAKSNGLTFLGPVPSGGDGVHPGTPAAYRAMIAQPVAAPADGGASARLQATMAGMRQPSNATPAAPAATPAAYAPPPATPAAANPTNPFAAMSASDFFAATTGGATPAAPAPSTPATAPAAPSGAGGANPTNPYAAMTPAQFFAATTGAPPPAAPGQAGNPAAGGSPGQPVIPAAANTPGSVRSAPAAPPAPGDPPMRLAPGVTVSTGIPWVDNAAVGLQHAAAAIPDTLARPLYRLGGRLLSGSPTPGDATPAESVAALDQQDASYRAKYGNSFAASAGDIAGSMLTASPILRAGGAVLGQVGGRLATAADAVAPEVGSAVRSVGNFLTGQTAGPVAGSISRGISGGVQGGTVAAVTSGQSDAPVLDQVKDGALGGAILGAGVPAVAGAVRGTVSALTGAGGASSASDAQLAQLARNKYGIMVRGGQISSSPVVKGVDATLPEIPFSGQAAANAALNTQFTTAVARTIGAPAGTTQITPDVMSAVRTRLGQQFDNIANRTTISADPQFVNDLARIEVEAPQTLAASEVAPIRAQIDNVLGKVNANGTINGDVYQALTRKNAPLDRAMQDANPNVRFYAGQVRDALDDAMERSLPPGSTTLADLQQARYQWKNMRTIQPLVVKDEPGEISPGALEGAVNRSYTDRAFAGPNGQDAAGDLGELATIGKRFLAPSLGNSGTSMRTAVKGVLGTGLAGAGGAYGYADPINLLYGAGGLASTALAARAAGSYLRSNFYTNNLIRGGLPGAGPGLVNQLTGAVTPYLPFAAPPAGQAVNRLFGGAAPQSVNPSPFRNHLTGAQE